MSQQQPVGSRSARPHQVTTAVILAVVGTVLLVTSLFDTLATLGSAESRSAIDDALSRPPGSGLGISTGQVVDVLRALVYLSGALAAATLVLAVFVAQRHRGARIGFTVSAALLLATVPVAGLMPFLIAVSVLLVWSRPARDWYAGRVSSGAVPHHAVPPGAGPHDEGRPDTARPDTAGWDTATSDTRPPGPGPTDTGPTGEPQGQVPSETMPPGAVTSDQGPPPSPYPFGGAGDGPAEPWRSPRPPGGPDPSASSPRPEARPSTEPGRAPEAEPGSPPGPHPGPGQQQPGAAPGWDAAPPAYPGAGAPPYGSPYGYQPVPPAYGVAGPPPDRRPTTVMVAGVLTWLGAGAVLAAMVVLGVVLAGGGGMFVDEFQRAAVDADVTLTDDQILALGWSVIAVFAGWSLVSILLAVFAVRRSNAARWTLAVSAAMACLLSLLMILSVVSLVTLVLAGAALVLLFTGGANDWYSRRGAPGHRGQPPGWPGQPTQPGQPTPGQYGDPGQVYPGAADPSSPPPGTRRRNQPW